MDPPLAQAAHFSAIDWLVVAAYLAATTWIGARLAGRQATIRDFFLGGRKLPWWAVAGSNIATEISAVTFISVPALVYVAGGDFRYLQLAFGSIIARGLIAWVFVPAYYAREIYSPYQYMGQRLGPNVDPVASGLFLLGATLSQAVRLFTTALVLEVVTGISLPASIWIIGLFAVVWTLLGGITTVIWTDVVQFIVLVAGAATALVWVFGSVPGGAAAVLQQGAAENRFRLFDLSADPAVEFTLWSGLVGMTFLNLAALGTDQIMVQRIFCCRGPGDARRAVLAGNLGLFMPVLLLFVGAGLAAYFGQHPLPPGDAAFVADRSERVFPLFIVRALPAGVSGLVIAAVFAAAISTLDGTLAALAQTSVTSLYLPWRRARGRPAVEDRAAVRLSRWFVVAWGVVLSAVATGLISLRGHGNLINLALAVPSYTYGALLGTLLLALLPMRRDDRGLIWGVPASVLAVLAVSTSAPAARIVTWAGCAALLVVAVRVWGAELRRLSLLSVVVAGILALDWLSAPRPEGPARLILAYPWYYPLGTTVAFVLGWGMASRKRDEAAAAAPGGAVGGGPSARRGGKGGREG